jgi:mRNA-degrading endonuclease RelE of RelBE toxin-antitoxin system
MKVFQTPTFARKYKKLNRNNLIALNNAIREIIKDPSVGPIKRGDLREIRVHKYRDQKDQLLIAYWIPDSKTLELIDFGTHENFYRDLKRK